MQEAGSGSKTEGTPTFRSDGCNNWETVVFWRFWLADFTKTHESSNGGSGPQGIFAIRPELLVPFTGEWAA
jgi:hypothetical protein